MNRLTLIVLIAAAVGCNKPATEAGSNLMTEGPDDIRVRGEIGDTYTYNAVTKIEAIDEKGSMSFTADMAEKLTKQEGDTFEWETTFDLIESDSDGVMAGGDAAFNMLDGMVMISVQDERGNVSMMKLGDFEVPNEGSSNVVLPPAGVKVGDTWDAVIDLSGQKLDITYKLAGYEKMDGMLAAKIVGTYHEDGSAKSIEPTEFWVDTANGKLIKGHGVSEITSDGKKMRLSYVIKRIPNKSEA